MEEKIRFPAGWGFPLDSRKAHYFSNGEIRSLCDKWLFTGPRDPEDVVSKDDCARCRTLLRKLTPVAAR